jgi:hypothetical protein
MPEEMAGIAAETGANAETGTEIETTGAATTESQPGTEVETSEQPSTETKPAVKTRASLETLSGAKKDALKAIDPSLPGLIRDAVFAQKTLLREFPGGLKEAVGLRDAYEGAGGEAGIRESQEALADYGRLEQWFEAGDKQFAERLAESSPESFSAMMPSGLEVWRQKDSEMYTHVMAKVMMNTLGPNVLQVLRSAYEVLSGDKANSNATAAIADLHDKLFGFSQAAQQTPERKVDPNKQALNQRENELNQREMRANLSPVRSEGLRQIESTVESEMNRSFQWSDTDPDIREAVISEVRSRIVKASKKDAGFGPGYQRLLEQQDWAGLKRYITRYQARILPSIVQQAARLFNVKAKGAAPIKKAVAAVKTAVNADPGWVKVGGPPQASTVDRSKTNADMILDSKAILKGGKKVIWA